MKNESKYTIIDKRGENKDRLEKIGHACRICGCPDIEHVKSYTEIPTMDCIKYLRGEISKYKILSERLT
jgi:hypothetical protein